VESLDKKLKYEILSESIKELHLGTEMILESTRAANFWKTAEKIFYLHIPTFYVDYNKEIKEIHLFTYTSDNRIEMNFALLQIFGKCKEIYIHGPLLRAIVLCLKGSPTVKKLYLNDATRDLDIFNPLSIVNYNPNSKSETLQIVADEKTIKDNPLFFDILKIYKINFDGTYKFKKSDDIWNPNYRDLAYIQSKYGKKNK
jgi:hypothetical protein